MADLVRRLREACEYQHINNDVRRFQSSATNGLVLDAADLLERAVKVMRPFADLKPPEKWGDLEGIHVFQSGWLLAGNIRAARDLIKEIEGDPT